MRGDRPRLLLPLSIFLSFTPHARGSTHLQGYAQIFRQVYPACAGIDRAEKVDEKTMESLPRMRGDRPQKHAGFSRLTRFTPHARGSTAIALFIATSSLVYPACAGIDRMLYMIVCRILRLPRMRGDRPSLFLAFLRSCVFTPHARGSTATITTVVS